MREGAWPAQADNTTWNFPLFRQALACVVDSFRPQEIALLLGKTEAAVRQNLHAARKRLAERLGRTGTREEDR